MSFKRFLKESEKAVNIAGKLDSVAAKFDTIIAELDEIKNMAGDRETQKMLGGADLSASIDKIKSQIVNTIMPELQKTSMAATGMSGISNGTGQLATME